MSQHPSLRSPQKGKKHRSVLKRYERVKELKGKEKWAEGNSVFGLLKLKILKFKLKKEKAQPAADTAEGVAAAEGAPADAGAGAQEDAKGRVEKGAAPKPEAKKEEKKKK